MKGVFKCPAKINLTLEIIGKRQDGFHDLRTVMLKLPKLSDELEINIDKNKSGIIIECDNEKVPIDEKNICYEAANLFLNKINKKAKVEIKIKKKIPIGAGLGGGSSNAAGVFLFLNKCFDNYFLENSLMEMAAGVGKDVPIFISSQNGALVEGAGEKISNEFNFISRGNFILINPNIHISTPEAFGWLDEELWFMDNKDRANISKVLLNNLKSDFEKYFYNDFEVSVERRFPIIKEIKGFLLSFGANGVLMSGSGSTIFGYFKDRSELLKAEEILKNKYKDFLIKIA